VQKADGHRLIVESAADRLEQRTDLAVRIKPAIRLPAGRMLSHGLDLLIGAGAHHRLAACSSPAGTALAFGGEPRAGRLRGSLAQ
jgi:hypothetical protein